jgi:sigma-B regulation protein RsbU (phosphoserine phosphatase)
MSIDQQTARTRFELKTLLDATQLLIEPNDLDFVLNNLLLIVMGKMMVGKTAIFLYQPYTDDYQVAKTKGRTGFVLSETFSEPMFRNQAEEHFYHLHQVPESGKPGPEIAGSGLQTFINLKTSALHLGVLGLGARMDGTVLSNEELHFLEGLCIISAAGIANSQLFGELRKINRELDKRVQELHTLFDLSQEFSTTVDRTQIIRIFKFALLGQLMVNNFFFLMKRGDRFEMIGRNSIKGEPTPAEMQQLFNHPDDIVVVNDTLRAEVPFLEYNGIRVLGGIKVGTERSAIVGVGKRVNGQEFSESDFGFLLSLANLAVLSVQKTFLLEERIQRKQLEEELKLARTIQEGLLPRVLPKTPGIDIAATNIASQQVGGDYYDVLLQKDGRLYIAIADVTGKGVPASLIMANLQSMLHALTFDRQPIEELTGRFNEIIYRNTPADKFVTFFWGCIDTATRQFCYVNAGHNPPMLLRAGGETIEQLTEGGLLLGAMPTLMPYRSATTVLNPGDMLVLYTDGVTEAENPSQEQYEEARLETLLRNERNLGSQGVLDAIIHDVSAFTAGNYNDDVTLLVVKINEAAA